MNQKLFVGNLCLSTSDEALLACFEQHGQILFAEVVRDRMTGQSRGFGFVEFGTPEEADEALHALDGSTLDGQPIRVTLALERAKPLAAGNGRERLH